MDVTATAVEITGLRKRYGKTEAVSSLVLQVRAGTTFGLVGANGAGKTTLIKCMLAFCDFDEGISRFLACQVTVLKRANGSPFFPKILCRLTISPPRLF